MTVTEKHREAMAIAEEADRIKAANPTGAKHAYVRAFALEVDAASEVKAQPSRAILYRSAAWLAMNAGLAVTAKLTATAGLEGAHPEIAAELREVIAAAEAEIARVAE